MTKLNPDESDAVTLWAEIHRLRAAVAGPDGHATWQDAATAERVRRVAAEKAQAASIAVMQQALDALESCMGVPHWPSLTPTISALRAATGGEASRAGMTLVPVEVKNFYEFAKLVLSLSPLSSRNWRSR